MSRLFLAAIGFVALILQPPPETLVDVGRHVGFGWAVLIGWPAMMSIGLACFGANAQAALKAPLESR